MSNKAGAENVTHVLINTANLHVGGGVQVAASFLNELADITLNSELEISIVVSDTVYQNLKDPEKLVQKSRDFWVENAHGMDLAFYAKLKPYSAIFTVFGPAYFALKRHVHIVGFAQPWIIYPENEVVGTYSFLERLKSKLFFNLQWWFFNRANRLVVEADHVSQRLRSYRGFKNTIDVVPNCISALYNSPETWCSLPNDKLDIVADKTFKIGYLTRDYPHKNCLYLLDVQRLLNEIMPGKVQIYVSLNDAEMSALGDSFRQNILTVGSLRANQCPSFYTAMDAMIFPSFLECFSAMPIESMKMRKPVFASDRAFVKDFCGDIPFYIDPLSPESAVNAIVEYIENEPNYQSRLDKGNSMASNYENPRLRAHRYLELIMEEVNQLER